jgi:hypothetical protein
MTTAVLGLQEIAPSQAQPNVPLNENARILDAVVQLSVLSVRNSPAGGEADGARYIVGSSPSGAFSAFAANAVAYLSNGTWLAVSPTAGWLAWNQALGGHYRFTTGSPGGWNFVF